MQTTGNSPVAKKASSTMSCLPTLTRTADSILVNPTTAAEHATASPAEHGGTTQGPASTTPQSVTTA
ncbi:hypothetical protein M011DRAFT_478054 [Sporormia fimetaria CBS 119925]|uniref:Uncharacterized protein n=1 Tax=Sporormia fimetaria CBS 119925 TaxID=1340428 RepID=A0A6A6V7E9_9PLEO|nr:hypothetical protein M011DRAFT_478054 [Sporormia fimetaria CBS 119925]